VLGIVLRNISAMQTNASELTSATAFPFRLAAVDLDNTLLGADKKISAANARAIQQLRSRNIQVVLASGRRHENMLQFHRQLGLSGAIVSSGGALVKQAETDEILLSQSISTELALDLAITGTEQKVSLIYYHLDGVYVRDESEWTALYQQQTKENLIVQNNLHDLASQPPFKVLWSDTPERIADLLPQMRERYGDRLEVIITDPQNLEFTAIGVDKAVGVASVAQHYNLAPSQVLSFGDGNNDAPMLKWSGFGVAVGHASPSAKAAADFIVPDGDPETSFARAVDAVLAGNAIDQYVAESA
jgi:Cof subfamily protein (haloacid dehalogenase superfamily)